MITFANKYNNKKIKHGFGDRAFDIIVYAFLLFAVLFTLYPMLYLLAKSFSSETSILRGQVTIFPVDFSTYAYEVVFQYPLFWQGYFNSIFYTMSSVIVGLFMSIICAYSMSKHFVGKRALMLLCVFTMFFDGGLIPNYLLIDKLKLTDNPLAIILLPGVISIWNMVLLKTSFQAIPGTLEEAAAIDGLNPIQNLFLIVVPLSKPIIATVALYIGVFQWNNWFYPMMYLRNQNKMPIVLFLRNIVFGAQLSVMQGEISENMKAIPTEGLKVATIMLVSLPIMCVYPFVQKYFVKGVMVGSLKG